MISSFRHDRNVNYLAAFFGDPPELQFGCPWIRAAFLSRACRIPAWIRRGWSLCLPISGLVLLSLVRGRLQFWVSDSFGQAWFQTLLFWLSLRISSCGWKIFPRYSYFGSNGFPRPPCWSCSSPLWVDCLLVVFFCSHLLGFSFPFFRIFSSFLFANGW